MSSLFIEHYQFNTQTLTYEKLKLPRGNKFKGLIKFVSAVIIFSIFIFALLFTYFFNFSEYLENKHEKEKLIMKYETLNEQLAALVFELNRLQHLDDSVYRFMLNTEALPQTMRAAGYGGSDRYTKLKNFANSEIVIETTRRVDEISKKLLVQSKSFREIFELARQKAHEIACIPALQPVSKRESFISSHYGMRLHPYYKVKRMHWGVDFSAEIGTKVYATADGTVEETGFLYGYGKQILLNHGYGYKTRYAHLSKSYIGEGQKVKRGDIIAEVGNSGTSTASHLHYEVIRNGSCVNPVNYYFQDITPDEYCRMLQMSED